MEDSQKPRGLFYGWVIVLAGTLIMAAFMGIVYNCFSQFIKPVCEDLGFTRQAMSMNQTIISLIQVGVAFAWGWILMKVRIKNLMLFWAVIGSCGFFLYSYATKIWMFYLISVVMSVSMALLTMLPFSYIVSNWFHEKRGLAMGICFMGSGLGGMILNPFLGLWLVNYGWRMSFRILAVIMAVVSIPCVLLVKVRPEHMGLRALGSGNEPDEAGAEEEAWGYTLTEAKRMPKFWILAACTMMVNMGLSGLVQTLSPHLTDNGYSVTFAAMMVSVSMGTMALGKMILGQFFDMLGTRKASAFSMACGFFGLVGMIFCQFKAALILIVLGIGFGCSFSTVGNPIVVQNVFGKKDFGAIMGIFTACNSLGGAISPTVNGTAFDMFGSYRASFFVWAGMIVAVLVCYAVFLPSSNGHRSGAEGQTR
ncbi:MAG: MFS transporter [Clostridiaceae bacterium]|nr:MFS transporter [Clostridiaceae bacterium]